MKLYIPMLRAVLICWCPELGRKSLINIAMLIVVIINEAAALDSASSLFVSLACYEIVQWWPGGAMWLRVVEWLRGLELGTLI